ncbi:iron-containing alcohol dehydrogenase [candidate division KSB1 bacterium]|nr:iron-containing alcohol dehydrogenase [candidate division KSB1 bacterium]
MFFEFATAGRIIFGAGKITELVSLVPDPAGKVFLITSSNVDRVQFVINLLHRQNIATVLFDVGHEPTTGIVLDAVKRAKREKCTMVIGIGGGSVIDTGKAVAALLTNEGELSDYLEVIGKGQKLDRPSLPYIAVPTTAGTGAEVTRNAVLSSPEHKVKVSMRSPFLLPSVALVDPELTLSMPPEVTASTGLDALTQLLEAFVTKKANPLIDGICREGLSRAARSLKAAYLNGKDIKAREDMSLAGMFSGLALANAGLGAVHGFAGPLGGLFNAPHGAICARLLPFVVEANVNAIRETQPGSQLLGRFDEIARILTGFAAATASDGVVWIRELYAELNVPPLSDYGMTERDIPLAVEKSQKASSMKGNPVQLEYDVLAEILKRAL